MPTGDGKKADLFADITTEGSPVGHYWYKGVPYPNFSAWFVAISGTCSRSSTGLAVDANGTWHSFSANAPRVTNAGLVVEEARTNGVRNNTMAGAVVSDGVERTTNGNFALNPINASQNTTSNGWQWNISGGTSNATYTGGTQTVNLISDSSGDAVNFFQPTAVGMTTVVGVTYTITLTAAGGTTLGVRIGNVQMGSGVLNTTTPMGTGLKFQFVATATTSYLSFFNSTASTTVQLTNVSVVSAGKLPTFWFVANIPFGVVWQITGLGTQNGLSTISFFFSGTNLSGGNAFPVIGIDTNLAIPASYGQTWSSSLFIQTSGATQLNWSTQIVEANVSGTFLTQSSALGFGTFAAFQRISGSYTLVNPATANVAQDVGSGALANNASISQTVTIGAPQLENNSLINSSVASAAVNASGTGGVNGTAVYSVGGGTGTPATLNVTWAAGVLTVNSVASAGSYTTFPPSPATLTYVSGTATGWTGASVNLTPTNNAAQGFASTPILTSGSAVLRNADVLTATVAGGAANSLVGWGTPNAPISSTTNQSLLELNAGSTSSRFFIRRQASTGVATGAVTIASSESDAASVAAWAQNTPGKLAGSFKSSTLLSAFNSVGVSVSPSAGSPTTPTTLDIGANANSATFWNGSITMISAWLTNAISATALQKMTT